MHQYRKTDKSVNESANEPRFEPAFEWTQLRCKVTTLNQNIWTNNNNIGRKKAGTINIDFDSNQMFENGIKISALIFPDSEVIFNTYFIESRSLNMKGKFEHWFSIISEAWKWQEKLKFFSLSSEAWKW